MKNFLFRVDADQSIGFGHYKRCSAILDELDRDATTILLTKSDNDFDSAPFKKKIILNDFPDINSEISFIKRIIKENEIDVLISDINNYKATENPGEYREYIEKLNSLMYDTKDNTVGPRSISKQELIKEFMGGESTKKIVVLISFEDFKIYDVNADIIVIPYVGSENLKIDQKKKKKYLLGPKFFVLRKEFIANKAIKKTSNKRKKVLVSMGGSDTNNLTSQVIKALSKISIELEVFVVKGPLSNFTAEQIQNSFRNSNSNFEIINSPKNMSDLMKKSDIAITTSGLTQYETSAMGLPAIVISINDYHKYVVDEFAKSNSIVSFGLFNKSFSNKLKKEVHRLLKNTDLINAMSKNGKGLVDGLGAQRILDKINLQLN